MGRWDTDQIGEWLKVIGFEKHLEKFKEHHIDGNALKNLSIYDMRELLTLVNDDGTITKPTLLKLIRFRQERWEWIRFCGHIKKKKRTKPSRISNNQGNSSKVLLAIFPGKNSLLSSSDYNEYKYTVQDPIHVEFFKNPKFPIYLINYIQQESIPIQIDVQQIPATRDPSSHNYIIKFLSNSQEAKNICNVIESLFFKVASKIYRQNKVQTWLQNPRAVDIIQAIMDQENNLFTVCQSIKKPNNVLEIYFFNEKKFNHFENSCGIDKIIHNNIQRIIIVLNFKNDKEPKFKEKNRQLAEDNNNNEDNSKNVSTKRQKQQAKQCQEELIQVINDRNQENTMISVTHRHISLKRSDRNQQQIQIFGNVTLVNEMVEIIKTIKDKYCVTKYSLNEMALNNINYLKYACRQDLIAIEKEFKDYHAYLSIPQNAFYSPLYLKDEFDSRINTLLSCMQTSTLKTMECCCDIAEQASIVLRIIAQNNHCYCDFEIEKRLQACIIPRAIESTLTNCPISKSIVQQSDIFSSSSLIHQQATLTNGSIEIFVDDIVSQKVDIIIIPSVTNGLKENLIEKAGEIIQKPSETNGKNSVPFITEASPGKLSCKKILFVNWPSSRVNVTTNDDNIRHYVRKFISKVIQFVFANNRYSNIGIQSIAFAVPDLCNKEKIVAEEMIRETQRQIQSMKSIFLKVSFILTSDKQLLYQEFSSAMSTIETTNTTYGYLVYPSSIINIKLISSKVEYLKKCQQKMENYMKRCMTTLTLDGFNNWDQYLINVYFSYCNARCVLPLIDDNKQIVLKGSITGIHEAQTKYQLIAASIQQKLLCQQSLLETLRPMVRVQDLTSSLASTTEPSSYYNILLSYCPEDSKSCYWLADRLVNTGFSLWMNFNGIANQNDILSKMDTSECIILCVSTNYFENEFCEKEAKYACETKKPIIIVKIQNFTPITWLRQLIEDKPCFQMFGSENHIDLVLDKLTLEILQHTSAGNTSLRKPEDKELIPFAQSKMIANRQGITNLYIPLSIEQRKLIYQINRDNLSNSVKDQLTDEEKKTGIEKVEDIIQELIDRYDPNVKNAHDGPWFSNSCSDENEKRKVERQQQKYLDVGILSYRHWLQQVWNLKTKQNIPPFTISGDINDAPFPMLLEILENPKLLFRAYTIQSSLSVGISSEMNRYVSTAFGPNYAYSYFYGGTSYVSRNISDVPQGPFIRYMSNGIPTDEQIKQRYDMSDSNKMIRRRRQIEKYFLKSYKYITKENLKSYANFAQQMRDNANEINRLCEIDTVLLQEQSERKIQSSFTAVFALSTESNTQESPKTSSTIQNSSILSRKQHFNLNVHSKVNNKAMIFDIIF